MDNPKPHIKPECDERLIIYQVFPRILTNENDTCRPHGTLEQNGSGKMAHYNARLLNAIKDLGCNAIWFTGIIEHATKSDFTSYGIHLDNPHVVKGEAGSPYAIKDYYDVNPCLAVNPEKRMREFEDLVKRTHKAGLKMIIDFVPNHTARRYHSDAKPAGIRDFGVDDDITKFFSPNNNYYYITNQQFAPSIDLVSGENPYVEFPAKATGNDCFTAFCDECDWYETVKLNYGKDYGDWSEHFDPVPDTWLKMLHILRFWAAKGVDGFRCDMVFMVPLAFWHWAIPQVKEKYPHVFFIGEIYDVAQYRSFLEYGCFDYLYDKVNLYDTLVGIETLHYSAAKLTGCWQSLEGISHRMLNFLENHDEVRFASDQYAGDPAKMVPALVVSSMISKGPFMLYYGQELGVDGMEDEGFAGMNRRTTIFDYWSYEPMRRWYNGGKCNLALLTSHEKWLRKTYKEILTLCNSRPELRCGDLFDLMYVNLQNPRFNPHRQFAFIRHYKGDALLIVANFDDKPADTEIIIPQEAFNHVKLPFGRVDVTDLYTGKKSSIDLDPSRPVRIFVDPNNATILEIKNQYQNINN